MGAGLTVTPRPPDGVDIRVLERFPVAVLMTDHGQAAVDSDGDLLGSSLISPHLPEIVSGQLPVHRVAANATLAELSLLGAAPLVMLHRAARIYDGPEGITVSMRNGLLIVFGDAARPAAKWRSAEAVVADPHAAGATYVDVRDPDRPAAGGLSASNSAPTGLDPTEAELASQLEQAVEATTSGGTTVDTTSDPSQVPVAGADGPGGTVGTSSTSSGG
jgi:cell division protein FtsQ